MARKSSFFDFSKREQLGVITMLIIILILLGMWVFAQHIFHPRVLLVKEDPELLAFVDKLHTADSTALADKQSWKKKKEWNRPSKVQLSPFDPHEVDVEAWTAMGFSQKQAQSIQNYFDKGGVLRSPEDFKKLYVVNDYMYERIHPYIRIQSKQTGNPAEKPISDNKQLIVQEMPEEKSNKLDINTADSVALEALPGIGPIYAQRILKYRRLLGGYSGLHQLHEVYGLDKNPDIVELLHSHLAVETPPPPSIDINEATWVDLVRHPYIDKKVANAILAYREQHGAFTNPEHITRSHLIDEALLTRLRPYIYVQQAKGIGL